MLSLLTIQLKNDDEDGFVSLLSESRRLVRAGTSIRKLIPSELEIRKTFSGSVGFSRDGCVKAWELLDSESGGFCDRNLSGTASVGF